MKYLVFAGFSYYPGGGFDDFSGIYDTLDEAKESAKQTLNENTAYYNQLDWAHIVSFDGKVLEKIEVVGREANN